MKRKEATAMKKFDWKKYIYKIVVVILIVFFVGGVGLGAANILSIEGTKELYEPEKPLSAFPDGNDAIVAYADKVIAKALSEKPKIEMSESFSIDSDSIANSWENSKLNAACVLSAGGIESGVSDGYEEKSADFSEDASGFLESTLGITAADIDSVDFNYRHYTCSMCRSNINFEDYAEKCPECGNEGTLELRFGDNYEITLHLKEGAVSAKDGLFPAAAGLEDVIKGDKTASEGFFDFKKLEEKPESATVFIKVNRLTDKIETLRYEKDYSNTLSLRFKGTCAHLEDTDITFNSACKKNYSFTWPGVSLNEHERTVELGSSEVLKATLTCDDPVKYDVKWSSSDENILAVDEEGYLKTNKQFGDAVITAEFEFKGKTYSDSCLVHVGVPAEGVDLSKGKLKLAEGGTYTLVAEFDPKDTTNTVCYWFSEDENVAAVNENGMVTATGQGKTVVYVVTDDGNYYSSCKVEVTR